MFFQKERGSSYALATVLAGAITLMSVGAAHAASVSKGKRIFESQCSTCHSVKPGHNGIGPSLHDVYGNHAARVKGYHFSAALKHSGIVWNKPALMKFLKNPHKDVPGTKMPYGGLPSASKRADVIAYLKSVEHK